MALIVSVCVNFCLQRCHHTCGCGFVLLYVLFFLICVCCSKSILAFEELWKNGIKGLGARDLTNFEYLPTSCDLSFVSTLKVHFQPSLSDKFIFEIKNVKYQKIGKKEARVSRTTNERGRTAAMHTGGCDMSWFGTRSLRG